MTMTCEQPMTRVSDTVNLRQAFSRFATGVTVVAFRDADGPHGLTVNSFSSVSLEPALVLFSLRKESARRERLADRPFSINVLGADQEHVARAFAAPDRPDFDGWEPDAGVPRVAGSIAWFVCDPWAVYDGGDHTIHVGEVRDFGHESGAPLTFFGGSFAPPR